MLTAVRFDGIRIAATGSAVPDAAVATDSLCRRVGSDAGWVERVLGFSSRRVAPPEQTTADLAAQAARAAVARAGLTPAQVDILILATATPNRLAPSTAALVQERIGMRSGTAFDLNAVCGGFLYAVTCAASLIRQGHGSTALVIGADTFSRITNYAHRDCVFFGDGAGAVVLVRSGRDDDWMLADLGGGGCDRLAFTVPAGGSERPATAETVARGEHYFSMEGSRVFENVCRQFTPFLQQFLAASGVPHAAIDHVILHQASRRVLERVGLDLGICPSKVRSNLSSYGNTAAASVPLLLDQELQHGTIRQGDLVLLAAFGAGWVWGAALLPWRY